MAIPKLTRSPRSAQLHPASTLSRITRPRQRDTPQRRGLPLQPYAEKLTVYETLHTLNRGFEQVLADLEKLEKLRLFRPDLSNIFRIMVQETRTHVSFELIEVMHEVEQEDWALFGRQRRRWEKKYEDPNDILLQAEHLKQQRRKEAEKKAKRKRRGAGKKGA